MVSNKALTLYKTLALKIEERYKHVIYYKSEISNLDHKVIDSSTRFGYYILQIENEEELQDINVL